MCSSRNVTNVMNFKSKTLTPVYLFWELRYRRKTENEKIFQVHFFFGQSGLKKRPFPWSDEQTTSIFVMFRASLPQNDALLENFFRNNFPYFFSIFFFPFFSIKKSL